MAQLLLQWLLQLIQEWSALWTAQLGTDAAFGTSIRIERGAVGTGRMLASQPTMFRLLSLLSKRDNPSHLEAVQKLAIEHMLVRNGGRRRDEVVIDVDAVPVDAHGKQLGSAYHGHYKRTVFLPLIASCGESGDVLGAQLRPGNRREVTDCEDFMVSMADGVRQHAADRVIIRLDAGFNNGVVFTQLEAEGHHYVMRLRKNKMLEALAAPYVEDCSYETKTYVELEYGAQS
ncbi:MAG: transposase [Bacteroidetes bacterium]|nr:transposase [Bacteroidota bacterium]